MRIWTIHPRYLDVKGLVAAWREGLLAQKVLEDKTKGYRNHSQLLRFKEKQNSIVLIGRYLSELYKEAQRRGYKFDVEKIQYFMDSFDETILVTDQQIRYEFELLKWKLERRDKTKFDEVENEKDIEINSVFERRVGEIEIWEKPKLEILTRINK